MALNSCYMRGYILYNYYISRANYVIALGFYTAFLIHGYSVRVVILITTLKVLSISMLLLYNNLSSVKVIVAGNMP